MCELKNFFCGNCNKLMFKGSINDAHIEIKCTKCGSINVNKKPTRTQLILKEIKDFLVKKN